MDRNSTVAVVGLDGVGSAALSSLAAMGVDAVSISHRVESDAEMAGVLGQCAFAICTAELYRVNRVAQQLRLRWTTSQSSAFEAVLGPTIYPGATACYVCYKMRTVACSDDPAAEFAAIRQERRDREDKAAASGLLGHMLALETVKVLTGAGGSAKGAIVAVDTRTMISERHAVLRVPSCPVCGTSR